MQNEDESDFRKIIVKAAGKIFARYGVFKTTMEDISRAVRKGKSSLYYYFKSKEDILHAVAEKEIQIYRSEMEEILARENSIKEKIRTFVINRFKMFKKSMNLYNILKDDYLDNYASIEKIRKNYDKEEQDLISRLLQEGVANGTFNIKDVNLTANAMITALKGYEHPWAFEEDFKKTEKKIDTLLEVLFNGINAR